MALGNGGAGIALVNAVGKNVGPTGTKIGKANPAGNNFWTFNGYTNLIGFNTGAGISISGNDSATNLIIGNYIGVNAAGMVTAGNLSNGIQIFGDNSTKNLIQYNVISGNGGDGIQINQTNAAAGNQILANRIGTDFTGQNQLGNLNNGVHLLISMAI